MKNDAYTFNLSGGQVNIANDNAIIFASQCNLEDLNEINRIITKIKEDLSEIKDEEAEKIIDIIDMAKSELEKANPKVSRLRNCVTLLAPMITIANGIPTLVDNLQKFQDLILQHIK